MKVGDYVHLEDSLGPLNGRIRLMVDTDVAEIAVFKYSLEGEWQEGKDLPGLCFDLKKAKVLEIYENYEDLVENHFEEFL